MIKVGVLGADTLLSGELIRLLIHHPEVELKTIYAPGLSGRNLSSIHKGIIGESDLRFTEKVDLEGLDVVFVSSQTSSFLSGNLFPENLRIVIIQERDKLLLSDEFRELKLVPGVSEMYRKLLVREATASRILSAPASVALIALFPLALHLLLNDSLTIKVSLPEFNLENFDKEEFISEIETNLHSVQLSFEKIKQVEVESIDSIRGISVEFELECLISEAEIEKIYESIYDDHNFSFVVPFDPARQEVEGTQKCLIYISKPSEDKLRVKTVADGLMRGGAGDAIHVMNLLFGLFEKTGLNFPASLAFHNHKQTDGY